MYYFIVNPAAGNGKVIPLMGRLKQYLQQKQILGEMMKTTAKGDATHLTRIAIKKGYSTIIAIGGDSTVHEVLNGVVGTSCVLGVIPMGHNNFFAETLGMSSDWKTAVEQISARKTLKIDLGKMVEKKIYFGLSAGVGGEINLMNKKTSKSFMNFSHDQLKQLFTTPPFKVHCVMDHSYVMTTRAYSVSFVNSRFCHNLFPFSIEAHPQDGLLDVVLISPDNTKKNILGLSNNIQDMVTHVRAKEVYVESQMRREGHIDGYHVDATPGTFTIAPFRQKVIRG